MFSVADSGPLCSTCDDRFRDRRVARADLGAEEVSVVRSMLRSAAILNGLTFKEFKERGAVNDLFGELADLYSEYGDFL